MMEFGFTINIVQAIDGNMEWRRDWLHRPEEWLPTDYHPNAWYKGYIGMTCNDYDLEWGTYLWPSALRRKY